MKKAVTLLALLLLSIVICMSLTSCSGEILSSSTLTLQGTSLSGEVGYEVNEFDFEKELEIQTFSTFVVSYDKYGTRHISAKVAPLELGENKFYIHVTDTLGNTTTYNVNILRSNVLYAISETKDYYTIAAVYDIGESFSLLSNYKGLPVRGIGNYAFKDSDVKNVTLPKSIRYIGDYAFADCDKLESITLPDGLESISRCAFLNCSSLTSVNLPTTLNNIGSRAFQGCSSLFEIVIPDSVMYIGDKAFQKCERLTSVKLSANLKTLNSFIFYGCINLRSVSVPKDVTEIGDYAFYDCLSLKSVYLHTALKSIGDFAFYNCTSLSVILLPESLEEIKPYAFGECSCLTSIIIPPGVKVIHRYAFYKNPNLIIYCDATKKPLGWDEDWATGDVLVIWDWRKA